MACAHGLLTLTRSGSGPLFSLSVPFIYLKSPQGCTGALCLLSSPQLTGDAL